jgi:hypothetical protein
MTRNDCMTIALSAVLVVTAAAGADGAAGGSLSAVASTAPDIDACALLSAAEIQQAVGLPVATGVRRDSGRETNGAYSSSCVWVLQPAAVSANDPTRPLGGRSFVILNAMQWPAGSGLAHIFLDSFRQAAADGAIPSQPQPRQYGDEALSWGDGLAVRQRDVSFGVSVFIPGESKQRRDALQESLAPSILQRLAARK